MVVPLVAGCESCREPTATQRHGPRGRAVRMSIDASYNFRRVSDRVTTSGIVPVEQLAELRDQGYGAVINLKPDIEAEIGADEGQIVRDQGIDYVHLPVDFDAPTHADFEAFTQAMDAHDGQTVHVHCAAN